MIGGKIAVIFTNEYGGSVVSTELLNTTGKRVERLRKDKSWRQLDLAKAVNVRQNYISAIEKDLATPSAELMAAIAKQLETTLDFLMCLTDEPSPPKDNEPTFIHPEAEQVARIVDDISAQEGREAVLRSVTGIHAHYKAREAYEKEIKNLLSIIEAAQGFEYRQALERRLAQRFSGSQSDPHVASDSNGRLIA